MDRLRVCVDNYSIFMWTVDGDLFSDEGKQILIFDHMISNSRQMQLFSKFTRAIKIIIAIWILSAIAASPVFALVKVFIKFYNFSNLFRYTTVYLPTLL